MIKNKRKKVSFFFTTFLCASLVTTIGYTRTILKKLYCNVYNQNTLSDINNLPANYQNADNILSSNSLIYDKTLYNHYGINVGGINEPGKIGNSINISNPNYIKVVENDIIRNQITVEAWVKPKRQGIDEKIITKTNFSNDDAWSLSLGGSPSNISFGLKNESETSQTVSYVDEYLPVGVWSHVAGVYDGESLYLYLNGNLVSYAAQSGKIYRGAELIKISGNGDNSSLFDGSVDEVRIWRYARSAREIKDYYDKKVPYDEPGLIAYWDFD